MEKLLLQLSDPIWWFTVVIVGLLVNLLSAYAKPTIDKVISKYSTTRKKRIEDNEDRLKKTVNFLLENPQELMDMKIDVITIILRIILTTVIAVAFSQLLNVIMTLPYVSYFIIQIILIISYFLFSIIIVNRVRQYFRLRRILKEYFSIVYTIELRFRKNEFY